jgi:hypothetical protein
MPAEKIDMTRFIDPVRVNANFVDVLERSSLVFTLEAGARI